MLALPLELLPLDHYFPVLNDANETLYKKITVACILFTY
jgi:hypothetical protein